MPKIFDCFTFFNEFEILKFRLAELWDTVDHFVLVEADRTFSGQPKPLYFAERRGEFRQFNEKIIYVPVTDMPIRPVAMVSEGHQRNAITRGLAEAGAEDWILISDVDEIPRSGVLRELRSSQFAAAAFRMPLCYFKVNFVNVAGEEHSPWALACRLGQMAPPQVMRDARMNFLNPEFIRANGGRATVIPHGGWHFSYLGDEAAARRKIAAFSHQDLNRPEILDAIDIQGLLKSGADVFNRPGYRWKVVPLDDYFPTEIARHPERYADWIASA